MKVFNKSKKAMLLIISAVLCFLSASCAKAETIKTGAYRNFDEPNTRSIVVESNSKLHLEGFDAKKVNEIFDLPEEYDGIYSAEDYNGAVFAAEGKTLEYTVEAEENQTVLYIYATEGFGFKSVYDAKTNTITFFDEEYVLDDGK